MAKKYTEKEILCMEDIFIRVHNAEEARYVYETLFNKTKRADGFDLDFVEWAVGEVRKCKLEKPCIYVRSFPFLVDEIEITSVYKIIEFEDVEWEDYIEEETSSSVKTDNEAIIEKLKEELKQLKDVLADCREDYEVETSVLMNSINGFKKDKRHDEIVIDTLLDVIKILGGK